MTILYYEHLNNTLVVDINEKGKFVTIIDDDNYYVESYVHDDNDVWTHRYTSDFFESMIEIIINHNISSVKVGNSKESKEFLNKVIEYFEHEELVIFDNQIYRTGSSINDFIIENENDLRFILRVYMKANDALYKVNLDEDTFIKIIENISNMSRDEFYGKLTDRQVCEAVGILKSYNHLSNVITVDLEKLIRKYNKRKAHELGFGECKMPVVLCEYELWDLL